LINTLQKLPLAALPQPQEGATYATKLTNKDRFVDWQSSADAISRQIRALCDRMPVRCDINGAVMQIVAARVTAQSDLGSTKGQPGTIIKTSRDGLFVQCGRDGLAITQLKLNRGKGQIMDANAALNGYNDILYAGAAFDSTLAPPS
jgi:methionyl-tRNA formyltransferase